ncbi:MAG: type II secretion system secretin GspD [Alcanivoracaceae bacterium]|nr:type II secretion system secretin GspD [Alcanivoracaceae bacterium]
MCIKQLKQLIVLLVALSLTQFSLAADKEMQPSADGKTWTVNIRNADIQAFIAQVAEMTGKNFVIDPRVRSRDVTVISKQSLNSEEVYQLFLSVLQVHGYAAVPAGDVIKIVNNTVAKQSNLPLVQSRNINGEELITRVIPIKNSPVDELVPVLRPLVPQYGHLAAVSSANALIISDHADNIRRIEAIISHLDNAENQEVHIIQLENAWVGDLVKLLENLTPEKGGRRKEQPSSVTLVADERTNRLIIRGDQNAVGRLRSLVVELDIPQNQTGGVQVVRLAHADSKSMAELLKTFTDSASEGKPGEKSTPTNSKVSIQADESLNALVIRAEPAQMTEIKSVINQLDIRRAQILIEAAIVEVTGDKGKALGFQYAAGNENDGVVGVNFSNVGVSVNQILGSIIGGSAAGAQLGDGITVGGGEVDSNGDLKWGVIMQALASTTNANLLSTPSILTLDNQEASIIVGENVPFVTGQSTSTGAGVSNPFTTIQREDVGLTLKVTPHLAGSDSIRLELEQETSSVKDSTSSSTTQPVDIVTTKRKIQTTVLADDGETIVLGGLIRDDIREVQRKVPLLGDIPLLGVFFRSTTKARSKQNLMVFLRPTILADNERLVKMTRKNYLGITALQFEVTKNGDLERVVKKPLPAKVENLFRGRDPIPEDLQRYHDEHYEEQAQQRAQSEPPMAPPAGVSGEE